MTLSITVAHNLQIFSPSGILQLMRTALLCLCYTGEGLREYLLQRKPGDWFPHIPSSSAYWHELSSRDPFRGMKPWQLKTQMESLLLKLIEYSADRTSSRLLHNQPCKTFSAMQNRNLYGESFVFRKAILFLCGHSIRRGSVQISPDSFFSSNAPQWTR